MPSLPAQSPWRIARATLIAVVVTVTVTVSALLPHQASAAEPVCAGQDLLATLPALQRTALDAALNGAPYATGNRWLATKGAAQITLVGTMHVADPRMEAPMDRLRPAIAAADAVYLEATEVEMTRLQEEMARNPALLFLNEGPSLLERLSPPDWARLQSELAARGIPGVMAAKLQPWYAAMLLGIPACAMPTSGKMEGFDAKVMDAAKVAGVPMHPLEPYDTVFRIFGQFTIDTQIDMIRATLPITAAAEDQFATLVSAYFAEEHRRLWEFTRLSALAPLQGEDRAKAEADFDRLEVALLTRRNAAWVDKLTEVTGDGRSPTKLVAAFGAAHLAGDKGVLQGLADRGWQITREPF